MESTLLQPHSRELAITNRLNELGWAVNPQVPGYRLADTLKRFQQAHLDRFGRPLVVDGEYGPMTHDALFGQFPQPDATLAGRVLAVAQSQIGITEVPPGSNRGPQIDAVLKSVGLGPGYAWCAAFAYWCFGQAARQLSVPNPCPRSAGVLNMWALAGYAESGLQRIPTSQARQNPTVIKPGMLFLMQFSTTAGHLGLVESVNAKGQLITIEGNSNVAGSREGTAVLRQTKRTVSTINLGFISL